MFAAYLYALTAATSIRTLVKLNDKDQVELQRAAQAKQEWTPL